MQEAGIPTSWARDVYRQSPTLKTTRRTCSASLSIFIQINQQIFRWPN